NAQLSKAYYTLLKMTEVIGFDFKSKELTKEEITLYHQWMDAKTNKDFDKADQYRNTLIEKGIL
ncbi:MAG: cysteine--tRNA ligase, partial [Coprobacillaceae bacterium]